jgi:DNA-binding response OmpR family regulator
LHARVEQQGAYYILYNLGRHGTYIKGRRIQQPYQLDHNDEVGFAEAVPLLRFFDPDPTANPSGRLRYDAQQMLFSLDDAPLHLIGLEWRLLHFLYHHTGTICTRQACVNAVWQQSNYEADRDDPALDRIMSRLRKQLNQVSPGAANLIDTRRGIGYVLRRS